MFNSIYDLLFCNSIDDLPYEIRENIMYHIPLIANFFGFKFLFDDLKIKLHICEKLDFNNMRQTAGIKSNDAIIAFMFNINNIYVLKYDYIKEEISPQTYASIIVHECIHVFQFYFSKIPPNEYIWLYESIACFLAGQKKADIRYITVEWEVFENNFYNIEGCYGIAYRFGEMLFQFHSNEIFNIIKHPDAYKKILIDMYNSDILKRC